jgi:hypothetical protein
MDSAKLLGAVLTGLLTFVIGAPKDLLPSESRGAAQSSEAIQTAESIAAWLEANPDLIICFGGAIAALVIGMFLFFSAYFAYDGLLMPTRFWCEVRPTVRRTGSLLARPPGSAAWVLYANMLRIWRLRFVPATFCAGAAPVLLAYSLMVGKLWPERDRLEASAIFLGLILVGVLSAWTYMLLTRPIYGSED